MNPNEIPRNTLVSFERRIVEKHKVPHLRENEAVNRREQEILRKRRDKLDTHAKHRKDLTYLKAYAIDGEGAIFRKDAVSYDSEFRRVYVHIADPSAYFPDGSRDPIVQDALKKTQTIYATAKQLPMLPYTLNERRLRFIEERNPMPAVTFSFKVRENGSIRTSSVTIEHTSITVTVMSYNEANVAITSNKDLMRLRRVAGKLKYHREGVLQSRRRYPNAPEDEKDTPAWEMVKELMKATETAAGKYARKHGISVLYSTAKAKCLDESYRNTNPKGGNQRCKKLSIYAERHDGIGASAYVGVTSPLRNAVDLISHMQINAYLKKDLYPFSRQDLAEYADRFQSMEDTIQQMEETIDCCCERWGYKNCRKRHRSSLDTALMSKGVRTNSLPIPDKYPGNLRCQGSCCSRSMMHIYSQPKKRPHKLGRTTKDE